MPEFCTCGAELPPDARFCHRCGKPQRDEVIPETMEAQPVTPAEPAVPPRRVPAGLNFHNPTAVRIGLLMASIGSFLSALPVVVGGLVGLVVWWLAAGFLSVYFYRRRTGQFLTVDGGLRMGWITGLLGSAMTAILFTVTVVPLARGGGLASVYQDQLQRMSASDPNVQQALKVLQSPGGLAAFIVVALLFFFAIITFLCTAGGALGAKLGGRS